MREHSEGTFVPDAFLNVFAYRRNEIFLNDEESLYKPRNRFLDDSLAHELTHYLQVKYENRDAGAEDDYLEGEAVRVQTWFRETYLLPASAPNPCQAP